MRTKKIIMVLVLLMIVAAVFLLWNYYAITISHRSRPLLQLWPFGSAKCGIENCHGLDITCGPNVAEVCDAIYMAGDLCRQYATCQVVNGRCELAVDARFSACRGCVENCQAQFGEDAIGYFECEAACQQ